MRSADTGEGRIKLFFTILVLAALGYTAVKVIPVYVHNFELQDHINQLSIQAMAGQRPSAQSVLNDILAKANELDLPVRADDVKIGLSNTKITIDLDYTVPIDLTVVTLPLHFKPSAENRAL